MLMWREGMDDPQDRCPTSDRVCLIVDDEPSIRTYLRAILQGERIQSLEADDAGQALRIIHKLGGRLDLIVCDIKMPGEMDGIDLAYSIRNSFPAVPVLLISGYGNVESLRRTAANFEVIQKPFVPETILMAVKKMVGTVDAKASQAPAQGPMALEEVRLDFRSLRNGTVTTSRCAEPARASAVRGEDPRAAPLTFPSRRLACCGDDHVSGRKPTCRSRSDWC